MKSIVWVGTLFLSLGLAACQSSTTNVPEKTHHYSLKQKCPTLLVMEVGESLEFNVPENPTTGYQWQLVQPLKLFKTEETYLQKESEEGAVGVGGDKTFRFTALKPGQELIELVYIRSWETNKQPDQQWQCRIRIN